MAGAHQRLGADQALGLELDLRLIEQLEPVALEHVDERDLAVVRDGLTAKQVAQGLQHDGA